MNVTPEVSIEFLKSIDWSTMEPWTSGIKYILTPDGRTIYVKLNLLEGQSKDIGLIYPPFSFSPQQDKFRFYNIQTIQTIRDGYKEFDTLDQAKEYIEKYLI